MASLGLRLLGGFRIFGSSSPRLPIRKAEALIAYLAVPAGRPQPREHLAALLWGGSNDAKARHSLGQTLYIIRKSLPIESEPLLLVDNGSISLNASIVETDVAKFEALAAQQSTESLQAAAALYQGEFLGGLQVAEAAFESWLLSQQRRLQEVALNVLETLLQRRLTLSDVDGAIGCALQLLNFDPVHESVHRTLMRLYHRKGRRAAAVRQFRTCVDVLKRELDVDPAPETMSVFKDVLENRGPSSRANDMPHEGGDIGSNSPALSIKPSIAVLPFTNRSGRTDQEYLADGITDDVIAALSKYRWFFVISHSSSFTYKGRAVDVKRAAQELGVRYVLEGSVRKSDDRIRVAVKVIDAESGNHIWAESYNRQLADIFAVLDEITEEIVTSIEPELSTAERERARRKHPKNLGAWECYQRGLWHHYRRTKVDEIEAGRLFKAAIERDPTFSLAHAALAEHYRRQVFNGWSADSEADRQHALKSARAAVNADYGDAYAHLALGRILTMEGERDVAIAELEEALDLNPNLAYGHFALGFALNWFGRTEEALPPLLKAIRQSPRDPQRSSFENMIGYTYLMLRDYGEAIDWLKRPSRRQSDNPWPDLGLAAAYAALDRLDDARAAISRARHIRPDLSVATVADMLRPRHTENNDRYLDALRQAGLPPKS